MEGFAGWVFCCVFCFLSGASLYYSLWDVYGSCLTGFVILLCLFDLVGYVWCWFCFCVVWFAGVGCLDYG